MVYELTGNTASYGTSAANGAKLAFKEINAAGGVLGKQIQLVIADNKGEPSEAANAMAKVITQDKVVAITGITVSSCGIADSAVAEGNKIPFVAAAAVNPKVTVDERTGKVKDYTFRACFIDSFQGRVGADFALKGLKTRKAAILTDSASDYSKGLTEVFKGAFTAGRADCRRGGVPAKGPGLQARSHKGQGPEPRSAVHPRLLRGCGQDRQAGPRVGHYRAGTRRGRLGFARAG
jgi:branched-chain amino acid transport system substrate-binding protein